jgi:hypothetical protein
VDDDGRLHAATLKVGKIQTPNHFKQVFDEQNRVRLNERGFPSGKFATISREDLALYSGAWELLIAEAKKNGTMK